MFEIEKINKILNGKINGNRDLIIKGPCGIQNGKVNHISYIKSQKYEKFIKDTEASVIIVDSSIFLGRNSTTSRFFCKILYFYVSYRKRHVCFSNYWIGDNSRFGFLLYKNCQGNVFR